MGPWTKWTDKEDQILKEYYPQKSKDDILLALPDRSWNAIWNRAKIIGVKRLIESRRRSHLENLLSGSSEAYYWIGFLIADGYFKSNGVIGLEVSAKDKLHIDKYANFIDGKVKQYHYMCKVIAMNPEVREQICNRFRLSNRKTYECPLLPDDLDNNSFIALIVGMIDADGHIRSKGYRGQISLSVHPSWTEFLLQISQRISDITQTSPAKINRTDNNYAGLCSIGIYRSEIVRFIKEKANALHLPLMNRKWDRIDSEKLTRSQILSSRISEVKELREQGLTLEKIASIIGFSDSLVWDLLNMAPITDDENDGGSIRKNHYRNKN